MAWYAIKQEMKVMQLSCGNQDVIYILKDVDHACT
jgi:hypothetical protein